MDVCCGSDYTLNGGLSLFSPRVQNMSVAPTTNQPTNHNHLTRQGIKHSRKTKLNRKIA